MGRWRAPHHACHRFLVDPCTYMVRWYALSINQVWWCTMDCWVDAVRLRMAVLDCGSREFQTEGYL